MRYSLYGVLTGMGIVFLMLLLTGVPMEQVMFSTLFGGGLAVALLLAIEFIIRER